MIKRYDPARFREKFRKYRIFFAVCAVIFCSVLCGEIFLFGSDGYRILQEKVTFSQFWMPLALGEALLYLALFFLGLTIYAPFFAFLTCALRGALSGFCLSSVYLTVRESSGVLLLIFTALYLLGSAWLFLGYASFCGVVSLRLYSGKIAQSVEKEEKKMFGGTLFQSTLFCGAINLRFLSGYLLFFLSAGFFSCLLSTLYAYVRSRL